MNRIGIAIGLVVVLVVVCSAAPVSRKHNPHHHHRLQNLEPSTRRDGAIRRPNSKPVRLPSLPAIELESVMSAEEAAAVRRAVRDTESDADKIIDFYTTGAGVGQTYNRLADFVDTIGNRVCGSPELDGAVQYMLKQLREDGLDNVHGENVTIPHWIRGTESAVMLEPRFKPLAMFSLGGSIGTGGQNLTAPAIVVTSFDDLHAKAAQGLTQGKIIVYNQYCDWEKMPIDCYGLSVAYRTQGASQAHAAGGIASLARSVASFSINSPHTGMIDTIPSAIPTACITIEDAEMLNRIQNRGIPITLSIVMNAKNVVPHISQNVVAEWTGSTYPNEIVLVSGHLDSTCCSSS